MDWDQAKWIITMVVSPVAAWCAVKLPDLLAKRASERRALEAAARQDELAELDRAMRLKDEHVELLEQRVAELKVELSAARTEVKVCEEEKKIFSTTTGDLQVKVAETQAKLQFEISRHADTNVALMRRERDYEMLDGRYRTLEESWEEMRRRLLASEMKETVANERAETKPAA